MQVIMNQIFSVVIFAVMALMGGGSSLFMLISIPAVIGWKIYRMVRYGYRFTD